MYNMLYKNIKQNMLIEMNNMMYKTLNKNGQSKAIILSSLLICYLLFNLCRGNLPNISS